MWSEYDPGADALYIQIREARADDNIDIEDGVTVDVDEEGSASRSSTPASDSAPPTSPASSSRSFTLETTVP